MAGERTDIAGLIERLEAATGPSEELNEAVCIALQYGGGGSDGATNVRADPYDKGWLAFEIGSEECCNPVPYVTASLDAALALVERVRPGWKWERQWELGGEFIRLLAPDYHRWTFKGALNRSATGWQSCEAGDAIALCLALLKSLETEQ